MKTITTSAANTEWKGLQRRTKSRRQREQQDSDRLKKPKVDVWRQISHVVDVSGGINDKASPLDSTEHLSGTLKEFRGTRCTVHFNGEDWDMLNARVAITAETIAEHVPAELVELFAELKSESVYA